MLPDLSILGGTLVESQGSAAHGSDYADAEKTLVASITPSDAKASDRAQSAPTHGDELDVLDFLTAFHRWEVRFYSSARSTSTQATEPETEKGQDKASTPRDELRLRKEMLQLLSVYFGDVPVDPKDPSPIDKQDAPRRLAWMSDLGLLNEQVLQLALREASSQTSPSVLAPLAEAMASYINSHCLPAFFLAKTKNLNRHTERGRLAVGIVCLIIATVLVILLAAKPSPLYTGSDPKGVISRWYRLALAPLWMAGTGYVLAAWTGVCVWLSLRGNREPGEGELLRRAASLNLSRDGIDAAPSVQDVLAQNAMDAQARQRWMAPELKQLLLRIRGRPALTGGDKPSAELMRERSELHDTLPANLGALSEQSDPSATPYSSPLPTAPIPLSVASPSLTARRVSILPVKVAVIKPAFLSTQPEVQSADTVVTNRDHTVVEFGEKESPLSPATTRSPKSPRRVRPHFSRFWAGVKHATGFAVNTEPVLDERVRREQQKEALKALGICAAATVIILVLCVAIP